jgi:hypothetical protein
MQSTSQAEAASAIAIDTSIPLRSAITLSPLPW